MRIPCGFLTLNFFCLFFLNGSSLAHSKFQKRSRPAYKKSNKMSNFGNVVEMKWDLRAESELRCEIDEFSTIAIKLVQGSAEIFGIEMAQNKEYIFQDENIAIFTWYGCKLESSGVYSTSPYIAEPGETPMVAYVNTHSQLEARRDVALANSENGPRVS